MEATLEDSFTGDKYVVVIPERDYNKIINGDYELANHYLQEEIERKNRLSAFELWHAENATHAQTEVAIKPVKLTNTKDVMMIENHSDDINVEDEVAAQSYRWSDSETKQLIELYRQNLDRFNNKKYKTKAIWIEFSAILRTYSWEQIESKFKNMKKTYKRIVDNNKNTGRGKIDWPYFKLMDDLIGKKPENEPLSIASSSSGFVHMENINSDVEDTENSRGQQTTKKPKRIRKPTYSEPQWFQEFRKDCDRRHKERIEVQREFLAVLKGMAENK